MTSGCSYFATATHYLTGIATALLLLVPPLEIFLDLRPMTLDITPATPGALYYSGFYLMQIALAFYAVGSFRFETLLLAACSFPIYLKALINVITGRKTAWSATGAAGSASSPFNYVVPQMLVFLFLLLTSAVGVWRDLDNGVVTLASAWNITNTVILGSFLTFAARESGPDEAGGAGRAAPAARCDGTGAVALRDPLVHDRARRPDGWCGMTWGNRFRMFFGSIGVLVLVAGLTLVFNQRQHSATSETATIKAVDYPVGSTYPGTVTEVAVTEGQRVQVGRPAGLGAQRPACCTTCGRAS